MSLYYVEWHSVMTTCLLIEKIIISYLTANYMHQKGVESVESEDVTYYYSNLICKPGIIKRESVFHTSRAF